MRVVILTISDRSSRGEREDRSGPAAREIIEKIKGKVVGYEIVPDNKDMIQKKLKYYADEIEADLIITTGGTGLAPKDITPEATREVIEREAPGFTEAMRQASLKNTPHAMLSRAVSGLRGKTLIINLPGSPSAVKENLEIITPALPHAIEKLRGSEEECSI